MSATNLHNQNLPQIVGNYKLLKYLGQGRFGFVGLYSNAADKAAIKFDSS
ncbi:UNKNOWN [Stylonychia lemnae]|uniref:Serine/threonine protein kinase n=1 Tax=Stylonychia lemnae TaxID=5949 RepID=A0A077ZQI6_STYLE|nr:UNKNOWN [Stylonychia lemnae]|eukprot:CDW72178.1 UNKNOWN [Stylonychia lemnae]